MERLVCTSMNWKRSRAAADASWAQAYAKTQLTHRHPAEYKELYEKGKELAKQRRP